MEDVDTELSTSDRAIVGSSTHLFGGWTIRVPYSLSPTGFAGMCKKSDCDDKLLFARRQDAERAIRALAEHGIRSMSDIMQRNREDIVRICCESLDW